MHISQGYGVVLITGRASFPIEEFWHVNVGYLILAICLAGGVAMLVSVLVLPSMATDEVGYDTPCDCYQCTAQA